MFVKNGKLVTANVLTPSTKIQVRTIDERPVQFCYKGSWFPVTGIEACWVDSGEWWNGRGEKKYFRVASGYKVFEVYYDTRSDSWFMAKAGEKPRLTGSGKAEGLQHPPFGTRRIERLGPGKSGSVSYGYGPPKRNE